jgi:hypothetical protein
MNVLGIILARYASSRFPGKPLAFVFLALQGLDNPAQGDALGAATTNGPSPERAG